MAHDPAISVVIPVYNSGQILPELMRQLTAQLDMLGVTHEILLVEDDGPDNSWQVIEELAGQYAQLRAFRMMRNFGQVKATLCGLAKARGRLVLTMDDDLQHRPDQIPLLLKAIGEDSELDCVFGVFPSKEHAWYRNLGSRGIRWVNNRAFGLPGSFRSSSFRCLRRSMVDAILQFDSRTPSLLNMILASSKRVTAVEVAHAERFAGRSGYTLNKQFLLAFDNICNVSMMPLRAVTTLGLLSCAFGLIITLIVLIRKLAGDIGVEGWTTVVILVSMFSGLILVSLGVLGEYMSRVLREVRGAPPYLVREMRELEASAPDSAPQPTQVSIVARGNDI